MEFRDRAQAKIAMKTIAMKIIVVKIIEVKTIAEMRVPRRLRTTQMLLLGPAIVRTSPAQKTIRAGGRCLGRTRRKTIPA